MKQYLEVDLKRKEVALIDEKEFSINPMWRGEVFESWTITKIDNGIIIEGDTLISDLDLHNEISLDDVEPWQIKDRHFLFWSWKTKNTGWCLLKNRKKLKIEIKGNYTLINLD